MAGRLAWIDADCASNDQYSLWSSTLAPRELVYNSVEVMTKRSKKKAFKRHSDPPPSEGIEAPEKSTEGPNQADEVLVSRQSSSGSVVDLSFFRASAQLYGELHKRLCCSGGESFTEASVSQFGRQMLQALDDLGDAVEPRFNLRSTCPYVMLLSMLLPALRKYLAWASAARSVCQSTASEGPLYKSDVDTVLWAMLAQHDILTRFSLRTARILRNIEMNEGVDHDSTHSKNTPHQPKTTRPGSQASSASSSCSSKISTPRDPMSASNARNTDTTRSKPCSVPQIRHITMELANVDAECKVHLASLTESLVEHVELVRCL
ncbi:unnamed protein product [Phytophthora fragariaefolia]|uniref:Unnamed protein product n=1 Tax=Phytophthora fragariaefolia TaxID=1490495 RepID=A0A9W7D1M4_9STRA|nr:unnamed protein product [Phytophthora fragariaefolia]